MRRALLRTLVVGAAIGAIGAQPAQATIPESDGFIPATSLVQQ